MTKLLLARWQVNCDTIIPLFTLNFTCCVITAGTGGGAGAGAAAAADGRSHAHLVVNLKQAIRQLRRELEAARAERDAMADSLKFTDMEELSLVARANFEEVQRLQLLLQSRGDGGEGEDDEDEFDLTPSGVRPTAMAMQRLENETRFLRDENASLKADLNKVRRGVAMFVLLCFVLLCYAPVDDCQTCWTVRRVDIVDRFIINSPWAG